MAGELFSTCPYENCGDCWGEWCGYCTVLSGEIVRKGKCKFYKPRVLNIMQEICYLVNTGVTKEHVRMELDMADEQLKPYLRLAEDKGFIAMKKTKQVNSEVLEHAQRLLDEGLNYREISEKVGFSPSAVGSWKAKGWLK